MTIIGIDNGVSGAITVMTNIGAIQTIEHINTPVKKELSYTKKKQWITRVDYPKIRRFLKGFIDTNMICLIERPMVNPGRHKATLSAMRALECTLIALETLKIPYEYIDSKEWQKALLPKGCGKGPELKKAAEVVAKRLFPSMKILNADSLLIAEYARRKFSL